MKRIFTLFTAIGALAISQNSFAQDCATTQPNTAVCSGAVANNFNNNNTTGFGTTNGQFTYVTSGGGGTQGRFEFNNITQNTTQGTATFTSPSYYKTNEQPGSVVAGVLVSAGNNTVITAVRLDILDATTGTVISSCTQNVNIGNTTQTVCIGINDPADLTAGRRIQYRFTFTFNTGNAGGPASRAITVDDFSFGGNSNAPLPVRISKFELRKSGTGVLATWNTETEENVSHYEVERSVDGARFTKIGTVTATGASSYNYNDATPVDGYYRIKAVDHDGKFGQSPIVRYRAGKSGVVVKAFPSPVRSTLTIQHEATANGRITISGENGQLIRTVVPAAGNQQTVIDLSNVRAGMYLVRFENGNGDTETLKVVKQ